MEEREFYRQLSQFKRLLAKEKQALIKNQAQTVKELLAKKEQYLPTLQTYTGEISANTRELLKEIKELQETNLLLTQQAISFGDNLMKSIRANLKADQANLYQGQKGKKNPYAKSPTNSYIIDSQV